MNSESKHTPGPWEVTSISQDTGNIGIGHRDRRILIAEVTNAASFGDMLAGAMNRGGGKFDPGDCHTQFANARLIAAAPDLLEALILLEREMVLSGNAQSTDYGWKPAIEKTRAAIARAEGKAS